MDYGELLRRAWEIIWEHKYLILLGVLVALTSGGNSGSFNGLQWQMDEGDRPFSPGPGPEFLQDIPVIPVVLIVLAIAVGVMIVLFLWGISTIARGGLIAAVGEIDGGGRSSFSDAWRAGWAQGWRLIGIGLVPAIPGLLILLPGLALAVLWVALDVSGVGQTELAVFGSILVVLLCIIGPIALILNLLRELANRACMLEDLGVVASYKRGIEVLMANLGPAIILFLIQVAITIGLGVLMVFPGIILVLCCIFWPVILLLQGAAAAYFSTLWTLAWRGWTGAVSVEPLPGAESEGDVR